MTLPPTHAAPAALQVPAPPLAPARPVAAAQAQPFATEEEVRCGRCAAAPAAAAAAAAHCARGCTCQAFVPNAATNPLWILHPFAGGAAPPAAVTRPAPPLPTPRTAAERAEHAEHPPSTLRLDRAAQHGTAAVGAMREVATKGRGHKSRQDWGGAQEGSQPNP